LRLRLGLPKPKHAPYNLRMVNQTTTNQWVWLEIWKYMFMAFLTKLHLLYFIIMW
jgi:hypothetical protein